MAQIARRQRLGKIGDAVSKRLQVCLEGQPLATRIASPQLVETDTTQHHEQSWHDGVLAGVNALRRLGQTADSSL